MIVVTIGEEEQVKVGRGADCECKFSDISVSRSHALFKFVGGRFVIEDLASKYGTLVELSEPFPIMKEDKLTVQVNRSVVSFRLKEPWRCFCCVKKKTKTEETTD